MASASMALPSAAVMESLAQTGTQNDAKEQANQIMD